MKKLLLIISIIYLGITYSQCSYEDECDQIDWIGVYTLDTTSGTNCTNAAGTNLLPTEIIIEAGSDSRRIILNEEEVIFSQCNASVSFGSMNIEYDYFSLFNNGCSGVYTRS